MNFQLFFPHVVLALAFVGLFLEAKAAFELCCSHGALALRHPCVMTLNQGLVRLHSPGVGDAIQ